MKLPTSESDSIKDIPGGSICRKKKSTSAGQNEDQQEAATHQGSLLLLHGCDGTHPSTNGCVWKTIGYITRHHGFRDFSSADPVHIGQACGWVPSRLLFSLSEDDFRADYRDHDYLFCWIRNRSSTEAAFSELAGGLQFHFR